jgi:hypothetical protein
VAKKWFENIEGPKTVSSSSADLPMIQRRLEPASGEREAEPIELSLEAEQPASHELKSSATPDENAAQSEIWQSSPPALPRPKLSMSGSKPPTRPRLDQRNYNRRIPLEQQLRLKKAQSRLRNAWILLLLLLGVPAIIFFAIFIKRH